jgi:polysaccharide lyase family 4-like protein
MSSAKSTHLCPRQWSYDHPYFTFTNQNGEYTISDIPAGKYIVRIWHEGISVSEKEVTINAAIQTNLSVE